MTKFAEKLTAVTTAAALAGSPVMVGEAFAENICEQTTDGSTLIVGGRGDATAVGELESYLNDAGNTVMALTLNGPEVANNPDNYQYPAQAEMFDNQGNGVSKIYIVGGEMAVSAASVEEFIERVDDAEDSCDTPSVERLAGPSSDATKREVTREISQLHYQEASGANDGYPESDATPTPSPTPEESTSTESDSSSGYYNRHEPSERVSE
ncbi:TPA: hypothetical protein EYO12_04405 [Candidatus Saccharibacteria bacterium]|nr:hypothetical protein [Candidatus Saccharibacteria bacterium]HIO87723.1 hypothetical protein [Candidatus Saccharibacteria bacterium]